MTDQRPDPPTSRRMNPLAWLIIAALALIVVLALTQWRGSQIAPRTGVAAPMQQPAAPPTMPNQPTINDRMAGSSNALGNEAEQANPSSNEPGGNMTTGGTAGQGGGATTGSATRGRT